MCSKCETRAKLEKGLTQLAASVVLGQAYKQLVEFGATDLAEKIRVIGDEAFGADTSAHSVAPKEKPAPEQPVSELEAQLADLPPEVANAIRASVAELGDAADLQVTVLKIPK